MDEIRVGRSVAGGFKVRVAGAFAYLQNRLCGHDVGGQVREVWRPKSASKGNRIFRKVEKIVSAVATLADGGPGRITPLEALPTIIHNEPKLFHDGALGTETGCSLPECGRIGVRCVHQS